MYWFKFSGENIQPELLAEELGMSEFRFPDEQYQHAEIVVQELTNSIIPHLVELEPEQIGDYLLANREEVFAIFDKFPEMHRMPLLVTKNNLINHGLLLAPLLCIDRTRYYYLFLQCMHFYLYLNTARKLSKLYQKYPKVQPLVPMIDKVVEDECHNELECAW